MCKRSAALLYQVRTGQYAMGLYCNLVRLAESQIDPCLALAADEEALIAYIFNHASAQCDLDKAWHGIHVLCCPQYPQITWPSGFLFIGGTLMTTRDWESVYGVAVPDLRIFRAADVAAIAGHLASLTTSDLRQRYDPDRFQQYAIYPRIWEKRQALGNWALAKFLKQSRHLDYVMWHAHQLQIFVAETAAHHAGLVIKYHQ